MGLPEVAAFGFAVFVLVMTGHYVWSEWRARRELRRRSVR